MFAKRPVVAVVEAKEGSEVVLRAAHRLARNGRAELLVCSVQEDVLEHAPPYPLTREFEQRAVQAEEALCIVALSERVCALTGRTPREFALVGLKGDAVTAIGNLVTASEAGLLVVGIGRHASALAQATTCPVFFARESPTGGVLAASDLMDQRYPTLEAAQEIAQRRAARLCLFHAASTRRRLTSARRRLTRVALARAADAEVVTAPGAPLDGVVRLARSMPAELIVIGTDAAGDKASRGVTGLSEQIVRTAPCSVLMVRKSTDFPWTARGV